MTAGFRAFVAEHEGPLLRTAYLLTGDPQSAEELLAAALAGTRRRWRRAAADPVAAVRRAMVRGLVPSRDRPAADRAVEFPGDAAPPPPDGDDQELRRAVLDLPPRTRAALVLRLHDALSEAEAAEVLDCSPSTVAALTDEATAALRRRGLGGPPAPAAPAPVSRPTGREPEDDAIYRRPG